MSSTNRSTARQAHISDYYVTPIQPICDLFELMKREPETEGLFNPNIELFKSDLVFFDPCAGGDKDNQMSYPVALRKYGANKIITNDIREDSLADNKGDYLKSNGAGGGADVIITNPPFFIAEEVIKKAVLEVRNNGFVIMLLRLNFFGSEKRKYFWLNKMPVLTVVHRNRMSFTKGGTDSIEYMHCIWKKGVNQNETKLIII